MRGSDQVARYALEASHGVPVTPNNPIGIVVSGSVREANRVVPLQTVAAAKPLSWEYTATEYDGELRLFLQDPTWLQYVWYFGENPPPSFTLDIGGNPPRRFVGARFAEATLSLSLGEPLALALSFSALYATTGAVASHVPAPRPLFVPENLELRYGAALVTNLQGLTLRLHNNLTPIYLATPVAATPRAPAYILARAREAEVTFETFDQLEPVLRNLRQAHADAGVSFVLTLRDLCAGITRTVYMQNCYQREVVEPLVQAGEWVRFAYTWFPRNLTVI